MNGFHIHIPFAINVFYLDLVGNPRYWNLIYNSEYTQISFIKLWIISEKYEFQVKNAYRVYWVTQKSVASLLHREVTTIEAP
jgi:hypothetical protein